MNFVRRDRSLESFAHKTNMPFRSKLASPRIQQRPAGCVLPRFPSIKGDDGPRDPTDPPVSFVLLRYLTAIRHASSRCPLRFGVFFQPIQPEAEPKASPRGGGRFTPGDGGGKGVSPRLNGGGAALGRSMAASGRVAEGKPSSNRRWKVGVFVHALLGPISKL